MSSARFYEYGATTCLQHAMEFTKDLIIIAHVVQRIVTKQVAKCCVVKRHIVPVTAHIIDQRTSKRESDDTLPEIHSSKLSWISKAVTRCPIRARVSVIQQVPAPKSK